MLRLQTLGGLVLLDADDKVLATQRRRLALLTLLAVAGKQGLTRDKLVGYLWPESSTENARHALEQLLYALRRQVSDKLFLGIDPVCLNPELIQSDVEQFDASLASGAAADAVAHYRGAFLDGFYLRGAEDFERWTDSQRSRLETSYRRALENLARADAEEGRYASEVEWRRKVVALDPLGTQATLDLMRALVAAGDRPSALQHARVYESLVRQELSSPPDPAVTGLLKQLQATENAPTSKPEAATPARWRPPSDEGRAPDSVRTRGPPRPAVTAGTRPRGKLLLVLGFTILVVGAMSVLLARERMSHPTFPKSLGVLPCDNPSSDHDDEYFSDGMTEELITTLGKIKGLQVAAPTSAFTLKNRNLLSDREIGLQLHVGALVKCTVRHGGTRFRINVHLVNAGDGYQVWSAEYERDVHDAFAVQDEISRAIASALQMTLAPGSDRLSVHSPTTSDEAYELYLRGRYFFGFRADETTLRKSVAYFDSATRVDSFYAAAYSGLSDAHSVLAIWGFDPPREGFQIAKKAALRALALDSNLAEAHTSMGIISIWFDLDGETAQRELKRAIALNPSYSPAHLFYAWYLRNRGSTGAAVEEARIARELDPLSIIANVRVGTMLFYAGQYDKALTELQSSLERDSTNAMANAELARVLMQLGRCSEAQAAIRKLPASFQNAERGIEGFVYAVCGRRPEAEAMLKDLVNQSRHGFVFASRIAALEMGLGRYNEAIDWLDRAIDQRDPMTQALALEPMYRPLRSNPRFHLLLAKAGLERRFLGARAP